MTLPTTNYWLDPLEQFDVFPLFPFVFYSPTNLTSIAFVNFLLLAFVFYATNYPNQSHTTVWPVFIDLIFSVHEVFIMRFKPAFVSGRLLLPSAFLFLKLKEDENAEVNLNLSLPWDVKDRREWAEMVVREGGELFYSWFVFLFIFTLFFFVFKYYLRGKRVDALHKTKAEKQLITVYLLVNFFIVNLPFIFAPAFPNVGIFSYNLFFHPYSIFGDYGNFMVVFIRSYVYLVFSSLIFLHIVFFWDNAIKGYLIFVWENKICFWLTNLGVSEYWLKGIWWQDFVKILTNLMNKIRKKKKEENASILQKKNPVKFWEKSNYMTDWVDLSLEFFILPIAIVGIFTLTKVDVGTIVPMATYILGFLLITTGQTWFRKATEFAAFLKEWGDVRKRESFLKLNRVHQWILIFRGWQVFFISGVILHRYFHVFFVTFAASCLNLFLNLDATSGGLNYDTLAESYFLQLLVLMLAFLLPFFSLFVSMVATTSEFIPSKFYSVYDRQIVYSLVGNPGSTAAAKLAQSLGALSAAAVAGVLWHERREESRKDEVDRYNQKILAHNQSAPAGAQKDFATRAEYFGRTSVQNTLNSKAPLAHNVQGHWKGTHFHQHYNYPHAVDQAQLAMSQSQTPSKKG